MSAYDGNGKNQGSRWKRFADWPIIGTLFIYVLVVLALFFCDDQDEQAVAADAGFDATA